MDKADPIERLIAEWQGDPERHLLAIDETRDRMPEPHREFVVFTAFCAPAGVILEHLRKATELREALPEVSREEPIKGTDIWRLVEKEEFHPFVGHTARTVRHRRAQIFIAATTQENLDKSPARVRFLANPTDDASKSRPGVVTGSELKLATAFLLRLAKELGETKRMDVVVDSSFQLGLSEKKRRLSPGQGESFYGPLKEGSPDFFIVSASEKGMFMDLLLLPDFIGNTLLHKSPRKLRDDRTIVTTREPFWFRPIDFAAEMTPKPTTAG